MESGKEKRDMKRYTVEVDDCFWSGRIDRMCGTIIPYQYEVLNDQAEGVPPSHAVENFRIAAGLSDGEYSGMLFQDSDVGKWIEAASYALRFMKVSGLEEKIDGLVEIIKKAQSGDGYLNSYYTCARPGERLTNIAHGHEMYCAGHLAEAAVAYAQTTGKMEFLEVMERYMDFLMEKIGPEPGKLRIYPGHPELELALYKLYQYTGKEKYLEFMEYLLLERGRQPSFLLEDPGFGERYRDEWFGLAYHQAHLPILEQKEAKGHAVRAMYLYAGLADLAFERQDMEMFSVLESLWEDVTERKMYVTGAVGSEEHGEGFGAPYDLPNDRAYAETCASIGLIFWARRMLKLKRDARYGDGMELALYNGALCGSSLDGKTYFYVNPLAVIPSQAESRYDMRHVRTQRAEWFGCACCPPNTARLIASLPEYVCDYDCGKGELTVHLYICGKILLDNGAWFEASGDYTGKGKVVYTYRGIPRKMTFWLRLPGWSRRRSRETAEENTAEKPCGVWIMLNGSKCPIEDISGYAKVIREWISGDELEISFDMSPHFLYADPRVPADAGRAAIKRGPLVYCLEEADNGADLNAVVVKDFCSVGGTKTDDFQELYLYGFREQAEECGGMLYSGKRPNRQEGIFRAVPYYTWGNRGKGEMLVWVRKAD